MSAPEVDWEELANVEYEAATLQSTKFPSLSMNYVPGEGDYPEAFIIGDAPGAEEDVRRRPFVGPHKVVRELMALAGLHVQARDARDTSPINAWLTNVVKFRPPYNRNPSNAEIKAFRPLLEREWRAVGAPPLIIPIGGIALSALFGRPMSILRSAGKSHYIKTHGRELAVWPMVHPAFALRGGTQVQELVEQDWARLGAWRNG